MDYHKARKGPQRTPCRREATNLPRLQNAPAGRRARASCGAEDFQNQSVACEARHAPTGPRAGRAPCAHARPAPTAFFVSSVSFVISNYSGSQRALARRPPLCPSVFSVFSVFLGICGSPASCSLCPFVVLCVLSRGRFGPLGLHGNSRAASGIIAAKGGGSGLNLRGSSKLPNL